MGKVKKIEDAKVSAITAEELVKIQGLVRLMNQYQTAIGGHEAQKHDLLHELASAKSQMEGFQKELEATYGDVQIDLKDGAISPANAGNTQD